MWLQWRVKILKKKKTALFPFFMINCFVCCFTFAHIRYPAFSHLFTGSSDTIGSIHFKCAVSDAFLIVLVRGGEGGGGRGGEMRVLYHSPYL